MVPVVVVLEAGAMAALVAAGLPVLQPQHGKGLLDTGSDVTAIGAAILQRLQIPIRTSGRTTTAAGTVSVDLYEASLSIVPADGSSQPLFTHPSLLVSEIANPIPPIDVLIGRDVILQCQLHVDGPGGAFSLTF